MQSSCIMEQRQDAGSAKVLFPLYAGKCGMLTAVLQYVYQAVVLGGSGMTEEGKELEAIAGEKLCDFERIGTLLGSSGVDPVFTACPPYPVSYHSAASVDYAKSYPAMLAADLRLEAALSARLEQAASFSS